MKTLAGLPAELLLSITDFLPVDDWICISLCSCRLFAIYNRRYKSTRPLGKTKLPLLRRIERDLPSYFVCYICCVLRKDDGFEFASLSGPSIDFNCSLQCLKYRKEVPRELELHWEPLHYLYVYRYFYFTHLQLAMRRFYLEDQFGISTEALSYTQVRTHPEHSTCPEITSVYSADAHISPHTPGLCLRKQYVIVIHHSKSELLWWDATVYDERPQQTMYVCSHVEILQKKVINSVVFAYHNGEKNLCSTLRYDICNTDAYIEICGHGSSHAALVLIICMRSMI